MSKADELKAKNENLFERNTILLNENERLKKENAELKRDKEDLIFIRNQRAKCMCEDKDLLTKAKEIIKKLTEFVNNEIEYDPEHPQLWNGLCKQAEQFLQEIEK